MRPAVLLADLGEVHRIAAEEVAALVVRDRLRAQGGLVDRGRVQRVPMRVVGRLVLERDDEEHGEADRDREEGEEAADADEHLHVGGKPVPAGHAELVPPAMPFPAPSLTRIPFCFPLLRKPRAPVGVKRRP